MTEPVVRGDLVSRVLERDPGLVTVFERHAPQFGKLRDPVLRRTMARLVTVEQAAGIAGVPVDALLRDLNAALGIVAPASVEVESAATAHDVGVASRPAHLRDVTHDLRDDLRNGREPFARIMAAVGALAEDEALCLRTIFEPVPLYAVLAKRGFAHQTERHAADDWSVRFWRATTHQDDAPRAVDDVPAPAVGESWLDVRGLEPPEPMLRTLAALEALPSGHTLVQVNVRVPQFLLPILAERGFEFQVDEAHPDGVLVRIRRRT